MRSHKTSQKKENSNRYTKWHSALEVRDFGNFLEMQETKINIQTFEWNKQTLAIPSREIEDETERSKGTKSERWVHLNLTTTRTQKSQHSKDRDQRRNQVWRWRKRPLRPGYRQNEQKRNKTTMEVHGKRGADTLKGEAMQNQTINGTATLSRVYGTASEVCSQQIL